MLTTTKTHIKIQWPTIEEARRAWKLHDENHYFVYDFEVIHNVYTLVNYYPEENRFVIYYKGDRTLVDVEKIIAESQMLFEPIVQTRFKGQIPLFVVEEFTTENFRAIFETPKAYAIGFNSVSYDTSIASFILDWINRYHVMPDPVVVREVSDMLIDVHKAFEVFPDLNRTAQNLGIYPKGGRRGLGIMEIDSILSNRKMGWGESTWLDLKNKWLVSNFHIDILLLNPVKSDEDKTAYVGLKRVAAQYGLQVVEPDLGIDLGDSLADINRMQLTDLLAYNGSDSFVTFLIYSDRLFQDQVMIRTNLINDYNHRFRNRVNINSTNAQLVKFYVAPDHAMSDAPTITTFFPVWDDVHQPLIKQIQSCYVKGQTTYDQMMSLDEQWTAYIQTLPEYAPNSRISPWDGSMQSYPRFRVKYGELQQDLLEYMRDTHPTFPEEAYHYYSLFRYADDRKIMVNEFKEQFPEPPMGFTYKSKKNKWTGEEQWGVYYEYIVPGSNMRITCSIGGVHGDVMMADQYNQIKAYIDNRNAISNYLESTFGTGTAVLEWTKENGNEMTVEEFGTFNPLDFITKSGKERKFIKPVGVPARKDFVTLVDLKNIIHADVASLYPSIIIILRFFSEWNHETNEWEDAYEEQRAIRLKAKHVAGAVPKDQWTDVERDANSKQLSAKLFLNNASGEMDSNYNSPIRMNRNAATMRIVGQLILLDIVHTAAEMGGESVSTNTDGVYLTGISMEETKNIVHNWEAKYALEAEPEEVERFVSKDANNRYEVMDGGGTRNASGGMLSNFSHMNFTKKWTQPPIVDEALIHYFDTHDDVPNTPIDEIDLDSLREFFKERVASIKDESLSEEKRLDTITRMCLPIQLKATHVAFKLLGYQPDGTPILETIDKISRHVFTKSGYTLVNSNATKVKAVKPDAKTKPKLPTVMESTMLRVAIAEGKVPSAPLYKLTKAKIAGYDDYKCTMLNQDLSTTLTHGVWDDIDIEAYVEFTRKRLLVWNNFSDDKLKSRKWHFLQMSKTAA